MFSLRTAAVFFVLSALFVAKLSRIYGHSLLQRNSPTAEFNCVLSRRELRRFSSGEEGHWIMTESGLEALEGDIQALVNCTEDGDVLLFDVEAPVQPSRRIIIPWSLTLSALVQNPRLENGTFPEASRKVTFLCPKEDEGVFIVEANECLLANFVFQNCSLNFRREKEPYGIVTTANCSTNQNLGTVLFHHLEFEGNFLNRSAALYVQEPSCSGIQIINITFENNSCIGTCVASLPSRSEVRSIRLIGNRFFEANVEPPILIRVHSGSNTTVNGLTASGNNGAVVHAQHANLTISNSYIFQNSGPVSQNGYESAGVTLLHSTGQILDCRFENNTGDTGSSIAVHNSSTVITRTTVIGCNATRRGGGVSITLSSTVRILDSFIANNSATLGGGGVFSNDTMDLQTENTIFERNSAQTGGGLYFAFGDLEITNCSFQNNTVSGDGAGLHCRYGTITMTSSRVRACRADRFGGGGYIWHSLYSLANLSLVQNVAPTGGGLVMSGSSGSLNNTHFERNSVSLYGGGIYTEASNGSVIQNCTFESNTAVRGGGIYGDKLQFAFLLSCHFVRNRVRHSGAGARFDNCTFLIEDNVFEDNASEQFASGLACFHTSMNASHTRFINNSAIGGGGGMLVYGNTSSWFTNCIWTSNSARSRGGGAYFQSGAHAVISNSLFRFNRAGSGGGAFAREASIRLLNTTGNQNTASQSGAVLYFFQSNGTLSSCWFERNRATDGGVVTLYASAPISISASSFVFNEASNYGGAIGCIASSNLTIENCSFASNSAVALGGSIYVQESVVLATNILFQNNNATSGGALESLHSITEVSASNFVSNKASLDAGAIDSEGSLVLKIENCTFASNSAKRAGGAILASRSVVSTTDLRFQNNNASQFGGAVHLQSNTSAFFSHCTFYNESSGFRGGAIFAIGTMLRLRNISITSCSAVSGGGIYLDKSLVNTTQTLVTLCEASESGGGILMTESNITSHGLNILLNRAVGTPGFKSVGGGIAMDSSSTLSIRHTIFDGNMAQFGAGIYSIGESVVFVSDGDFYNNSARTSGGAAYVHDSSLTFRRLSCSRSSAFYGGSFYVLNSSLTLNDSQLTNSSSTSGGGSVLAREGSTVVIEETRIQSSIAEHGGGIMLIESYFLGERVQFRNCSARAHGGGVGLNESSSFLCIACIFDGNNALQEGGALRLESPNPQMLALQIENSVFRDNDAAFGGAIHFQTGDGSANCSEIDSTECTFLALIGCVFENNRARSVGGAILANNPNAMRISCYSSNKTDPFTYFTQEDLTTLSELSSLDVMCDSWTENTAAIYGPIVGSYARRVSTTIELGPNRTEEIRGNQYVLRNHSSGDPLPTILLEAVDEFSQGPALIQDNQLIEAVMASPDGLFAGVFIVRMEGSRGIFTGISGVQTPGEYNIYINFSELAMPTLIIVVEIRECLIGEWRVANGTLCEPCGADTYNFHPLSNEECTPCPEHAKCDSVAIRPKKGFWHQNPCSVHLQRCLSERACNEEDRDTKLKKLGSTIENCTFDEEFVSNYSEALCREGYTGPLCGSCNTSHGRTRSFRCEECYERFVNVLLVVLAAAVLLGLSAFAINSALPSHKHTTSRNQPRREDSSPSSSSVNVQMAEIVWTEVVSQEASHHQTRTQGNGANTVAAQQRDQKNAELAKWKAGEIFKITINYLQGIGIAIAVNVAWTDALITLFETAEFIGGVTSEAAGRSTDCMTSADSSIRRSVVTTIVNLIIPALVAAFFVVFWAVAMVRNQRRYNYLTKRCLLSALVVSYLSYIAITKTAVNTLYCVDVHDSVDFGNYSTTKYWAVDTALKCYDGSHAILASVCGWQVLALFSLGFPVLVAYVLIRKRNQEGIDSLWLFETAGFLYRSYDEKFIFWESVILVRKAALSVIVVFAYPLGGNLQGLLAVCVLMIALYLHLLCSPYRSELETLNRLEGLSLFVSSLTFVSGLFLNDDRTSSEARATIAVFVIIANVGILIYFSVRFFVAGATYLGIILENKGVPCSQHATAFHIVKTFLMNRLNVKIESAVRRFHAFTSRHGGDSNHDEV